jgi:uncharacterized membrane-anchored protein YhcB (DUF1043 family)
MSEMMKEAIVGVVFGTAIGTILIRYFGPEVRAIVSRLRGRDEQEGER